MSIPLRIWTVIYHLWIEVLFAGLAVLYQLRIRSSTIPWLKKKRMHQRHLEKSCQSSQNANEALIAFYGPRETSSSDSQPESKRAGEKLILTGYFLAVKILVFG